MKQKLLFLKSTSRDHFPLGYSAQVWVVINGHFVKPSLESSSLGLVLKIMDLNLEKKY